MRALLLLLWAASAQAVPLYQYNATFGAVGDSLTETVIGQSTEGYWTNSFTGGGSTTKQTNPAWSNDAARVVAGTWATAGNTKTAFADVTITARLGTNSRAYLWARWGGAYVGGNSHPSSGYTAAYAVNTYFIYENTAAGIATILTQVAGTPADLNDFDFKFILSGSALSLYVNDTLVLSATDGTFTTGGIGLTNFGGTLYFDNLIVDDGTIATDDGKRGLKLRNYLKMRLGLLPWIFHGKLHAAPEHQVVARDKASIRMQKAKLKALKTKVAADVISGRTTRTATPTATRTPTGPRPTATRTPTAEEIQSLKAVK